MAKMANKEKDRQKEPDDNKMAITWQMKKGRQVANKGRKIEGGCVHG
eukprot:CAMPEP_0172640060 /NCGR_PEP_ID=MMETSP1068-20121228/221268_1 /TAXON_ID=35684 /ORGANISM="Pseudopedinella elastica, Strain CCMP716" /LENGTH=46 /DNA_ID= /DNA_START= /DNA_END= /DNA_ORIENTATION=